MIKISSPNSRDPTLVFLDKMLKERFLNRDEDVYADENFTDDEESEDDADGKGECGVSFRSLY
jgi:hypothetical protein